VRDDVMLPAYDEPGSDADDCALHAYDVPDDDEILPAYDDEPGCDDGCVLRADDERGSSDDALRGADELPAAYDVQEHGDFERRHDDELPDAYDERVRDDEQLPDDERGFYESGPMQCEVADERRHLLSCAESHDGDGDL
jgi:hypothetical protein